MTQFMAHRGFDLARAPVAVRVLLTTFLAMASLSVAVGAVNYQLRTGLSARGSEAWYRRGLSTAERAERPAGTAGPEADEAETGASATLYAKTPLELMDATHPHLFNEAFLFFVLGHILALCAVRSGLKVGVYLAGFTGVLADTASPWLIRFVSPAFAWAQLAGQLLMAVAFVALVVLPLREMWGGRAHAAGSRAEA